MNTEIPTFTDDELRIISRALYYHSSARFNFWHYTLTKGASRADGRPFTAEQIRDAGDAYTAADALHAKVHSLLK